MRHYRFNQALAATVFGVVALSLIGCDNPTTSEKWIGFYTFPNDETQFPLYMDLTIEEGVVSGRAVDGNMDEATIGGTVDGSSYSLLIHPVKQGSNRNQDLYYRGTRANDSIVGEWEHVVGVKGPWNATVTDLAPAEALKLYEIPCPEEKVASGISAESECGKDA